MAWDEGLETRIEEQIHDWSGCSRKRMFGGVVWLANGNIAFGIWTDNLICRVGPESYESSLERTGVRVFDLTGRPMRGWVMISPAAIAEDTALSDWLRRAWRFASGLMPKH